VVINCPSHATDTAILPVAECIDSADGSELINTGNLMAACKQAFGSDSEGSPKNCGVSKGMLISAVVALSNAVNVRAQRVGGVGGKLAKLVFT
jgi:hypothetical protein